MQHALHRQSIRQLILGDVKAAAKYGSWGACEVVVISNKKEKHH
jgi:hypothetical protein